MSDIKFDCPACKQPFEAPSLMAGEKVECPTCGKTLTIPKIVQRRCPKCDSAMSAEAVFCVACGFDLRTNTMVQGASGSSMPAKSRSLPPAHGSRNQDSVPSISPKPNARIRQLESQIFPNYRKWEPDVNDGELDRCIRAIKELGELKDPEGVRPLIRVLREQVYPRDMPEAACWALSDIADPAAIPLMIEVFHEHAPAGFEGYEYCRLGPIAGGIARIAAKARDQKSLSLLEELWRQVINTNAKYRDDIESNILFALRKITGKNEFETDFWFQWLKGAPGRTPP